MTLYRHGKRYKSDSVPTLDLVILLNSGKEEAYVYFELKNAEWPILISIKSASESQVLEFTNGNNFEHLAILQKLRTFIEEDSEFELVFNEKYIPLWSTEMEKEAVKSVVEDYFRLLNLTK